MVSCARVSGADDPHSSPFRPSIYCFHDAVSSETQFVTDFQNISSGNAGGNRLITNFILAPSGLLDPAGVFNCAIVVMIVVQRHDHNGS